MRLMDKHQVEAQHCSNSGECGKKVSGTWSTIYDQAFRVYLDNGTRFVANFKYSVKPEVSTDPTADGQSEFANLKEGDYSKFDSQCDKSMVGFVQNVPGVDGHSTNSSMLKHEIKCFYAE